MLEDQGVLQRGQLITPKALEDSMLTDVHTEEYVATIRRGSLQQWLADTTKAHLATTDATLNLIDTSLSDEAQRRKFSPGDAQEMTS